MVFAHERKNQVWRISWPWGTPQTWPSEWPMRSPIRGCRQWKFPPCLSVGSVGQTPTTLALDYTDKAASPLKNLKGPSTESTAYPL